MDEQNALMELPKNVSELVEYSPDIKVLEFEVFNDYLAILQERNKIRELKTINLKT